MELHQFLDPASLRSEGIAIAIVVIAVLLVLFVNRRRLQARLNEWRSRRRLDEIGSEQIRNLVCADGLDGFYDIDRLALTDDAILLLSYKPYGGNIYCAERISEWTQVIGQKSFKFENPLFELENQLTALRAIVGNVPLRAYIIFNHSAVFPKGNPEAVLTPDNVPQSILAAACAAPRAEILTAWEALKTHRNTVRGGERIGVKLEKLQ